MGKNKLLIKKVYSEHFRELMEIADRIDALRDIVRNMPNTAQKNQADKLFKQLEKELQQYAKHLESSGVELFQNAA